MEVLISCPPLESVHEKNDTFISERDSCLQSPYRHDVSDMEWNKKEIIRAFSKLDSFVQRINLFDA